MRVVDRDAGEEDTRHRALRGLTLGESLGGVVGLHLRGGEGVVADLALVPPRPGDSAGVNTGVALSTRDVDADHAALRERGVDTDAEVMRMGDPAPPMFRLRDQDGNTLLVIEG